jgi:hypothetical protein
MLLYGFSRGLLLVKASSFCEKRPAETKAALLKKNPALQQHSHKRAPVGIEA